MMKKGLLCHDLSVSFELTSRNGNNILQKLYIFMFFNITNFFW